MLDLFAAILSVDPPSLVAWAVLAFAAGMYPVGIMLGSSCSPCCGCAGCCCLGGVPYPGFTQAQCNAAFGVWRAGRCCTDVGVCNICSQCQSGDLPQTITVTFSGFGSANLCCGEYWNGKPVVLNRSGCLYEHRMCGGFSNNNGIGLVQVTYRGPSLPPTVSLFTEIGGESGNNTRCNLSLTAPALPAGQTYNCSDFNFTATSASGVSAAVSAGGTYDSEYGYAGVRSCMSCCKGEEAVPLEVEIELTSEAGTYDGIYVRTIFLSNGNGILWGNAYSGNGLYAGASLVSDVDGCGNCSSHCRAGVAFYPNGLFSPQYATADTEPCVSVPKCNPYGSYTLVRVDPGAVGGDTYNAVVGPA